MFHNLQRQFPDTFPLARFKHKKPGFSETNNMPYAFGRRVEMHGDVLGGIGPGGWGLRGTGTGDRTHLDGF